VVAKEAAVSALSLKVTNFVRACEALHWWFFEGNAVTLKDRDMIHQAAIELLMRIEIGPYEFVRLLNKVAVRHWEGEAHDEKRPVKSRNARDDGR
jgi:hypothetical protein